MLCKGKYCDYDGYVYVGEYDSTETAFSIELLIVKYIIDHCCKNYGFLNKSDNSFD